MQLPAAVLRRDCFPHSDKELNCSTVSVTVEVVVGDIMMPQGVGSKPAQLRVGKLAGRGRTEGWPWRTASGMH
jgi:hypothetical protein